MPIERAQREEERVERHRDGTIRARGRMLGGQLHGHWEWFRKDGTKLRSGYFDHGKQVGEWTTYTRDGRVVKTTQFQTSIPAVLHAIYSKHRRTHRENPDSKQMCCMWSTNDPPDIIEGTEPIGDMEAAFGIQISDDDALQLYDMDLDQAARKILELQNQKC